MDEQELPYPCLKCSRAEEEFGLPIGCEEMCLELENFIRIRKFGVQTRPKLLN